jgi:hypothetical protein
MNVLTKKKKTLHKFLEQTWQDGNLGILGMSVTETAIYEINFIFRTHNFYMNLFYAELDSSVIVKLKLT